MFFFLQQTHARTGGQHFSKEQGDRALWTIWALGTKKHKIKDGARKATEGMVGLSLVFHLFCKVSSDFRWIKQ